MFEYFKKNNLFGGDTSRRNNGHNTSAGLQKSDGTVILLVGRSQSEKASFIETARSGRTRSISTPTERAQEVTAHSLDSSGARFSLVDTPELDNPAMSDVEVFTKITDYLLKDTSSPMDVAQIVYLHPVNDSLDSRTLAQNLGVLSDVILGESGLSRLTIILVIKSRIHQRGIVRRAPQAPVFRSLCQQGATVEACRLSSKNVGRILKQYASQDPVRLRIQDATTRDPKVDVVSQIEERLGHFGTASIRRQVGEEAKRLSDIHETREHTLESTLKQNQLQLSESANANAEAQRQLAIKQDEAAGLQQELQQSRDENKSLNVRLREHEGRIQQLLPLEPALKDTESRLSEFTHAYEQTAQQLASNEEQSTALRQQLRQLQNEYGSLRSQVQLQENIEQGEIVQVLKDLNRDVDDISRMLSEYLFDNHVEPAFGREPTEVTALDAHDLPALKTLLGHTDNLPSLISTPDGQGMPAEDFLDYAARTLLCKHLHEYIFSPFHPATEPATNTIVAAMYSDVQAREPQAIAGKWRANSFKSIHKHETPDEITRRIDFIVQDFDNRLLKPLFIYFFGEKSEIKLEARHLSRLAQLYRAAWGWNSMLKGDVIVLGDFYPTYFAPTYPFDPTLMSEFEPGPHKSKSEHILGTLGLGLHSYRAVGGGKSPEATVVLKATVGMDTLYA